jgi:hypothetical protein
MKVEGQSVASPYDNWALQPSFQAHPDIEGVRLNWYTYGPFHLLMPYPVGLSRLMREQMEAAIQAQ